MSALDYHRTVFGYHGCDKSVADRVLGGGDFRASENDYDWLGRGIYFWEHGPARALEWAREEHRSNPAKIANPAVVGAVIHLGRCFDLLDVRYTHYLGAAYPAYLQSIEDSGQAPPTNEGRRNRVGDLLLRRLDCSMLNWAVNRLGRDIEAPFQTVRGVFMEGGEAFPGSCIMEKSHIQIAVRDPACVVGVFLPRT